MKAIQAYQTQLKEKEFMEFIITVMRTADLTFIFSSLAFKKAGNVSLETCILFCTVHFY
jgi:hypothetical protein